MEYQALTGWLMLEGVDLFGRIKISLDWDVPRDRVPAPWLARPPFWAGSFALPVGKAIPSDGPYDLRLEDGREGQISVIAGGSGSVIHFQGMGLMDGLADNHLPVGLQKRAEPACS